MIAFGGLIDGVGLIPNLGLPAGMIKILSQAQIHENPQKT